MGYMNLVSAMRDTVHLFYYCMLNCCQIGVEAVLENMLPCLPHLLIFLSYNRQVGQNLHIPGGTKVVEAKGRLVMPGIFEVLLYQ